MISATDVNLNANPGVIRFRVFKMFHYLPRACLVVLALLTSMATHADFLDIQTRVALQHTLKTYIDAGTVDGTYEYFDLESGQVVKLHIKNLHPVIFIKEKKYMMCADFLDANGEDVLLDFIVSSSGEGFRIEQVIGGRRSYLKQLFDRIF